jgi:hypothetical protein
LSVPIWVGLDIEFESSILNSGFDLEPSLSL